MDCDRDFIEKLTVDQPVTQLPAIHGTRKFITVFQNPAPNSILRQINPSETFHSLDHSSILFTPGFLTKICKPLSSLPRVEDPSLLNNLPSRNVKFKNCEVLL
jgi:hypothetical protein